MLLNNGYFLYIQMNTTMSLDQNDAKSFWWIKQEAYCEGKMAGLVKAVSVRKEMVWIVKICQGTIQFFLWEGVTFCRLPLATYCHFFLLTWGTPLPSLPQLLYIKPHFFERFGKSQLVGEEDKYGYSGPGYGKRKQ